MQCVWHRHVYGEEVEISERQNGCLSNETAKNSTSSQWRCFVDEITKDWAGDEWAGVVGDVNKETYSSINYNLEMFRLQGWEDDQ